MTGEARYDYWLLWRVSERCNLLAVGSELVCPYTTGHQGHCRTRYTEDPSQLF